MKDEIKKKIEDTADNAYPSEFETSEYYAFQEGAEYGYSLAQQSVNSELINDIKKYLNDDVSLGFLKRKDVDRIIFYLDTYFLSASQNKHSLNSDGLEDVVSYVLNIHKEPLLTNDNTEFELSMKELKLIINRFSASQNQQNENESDSVEFSRFVLSIEGTDLMNEGKSMEMIYELFLQSKTNPPKEK